MRHPPAIHSSLWHSQRAESQGSVVSVLSRSTSQGSALSTQASGTSFAPLPVRDGDDVAAIVAATRASIRPALVLQELAEKGLHAAQRKQAAR